MNKKLIGGLMALGLLMAGSANAVPCGYYGVEPSSQCRDGTGIRDSAEVINAGGYFDVSNWELLDRVGGGDPSNVDFWRVSGAIYGLPAGTFTLASGIWDKYAQLSVALKGLGAYPTGAPKGTPAVNWSLYQLIPGQSLYDWVYGATRSGLLQNVFTLTLYGVLRPTDVTEPGTLALFLVGAVALIMVGSRRSQTARL